MDLFKVDGMKLYIAESLLPGDRKTGRDLSEELRQLWYDTNDECFSYEYHTIDTIENFEKVFQEIDQDVQKNNKVPIIQLECHGHKDGIMLSSKEEIPWNSLLDRLRPVNISSFDFLLLNLSMCYGDAIIKAISPSQRSPFRAVISFSGEVYPDMLQESWIKFYTNFWNAFKASGVGIGICQLAIDCGLIYYNQEFIFDMHYDMANQYPELFEHLRLEEMKKMCKSEGLLAMCPQLYQQWVARKQVSIKSRYRSYFCFEDLIPIHEAAYKALR